MNTMTTCPKCKQSAEWIGCASCGDDIGTLICRACGLTMPGVSLGELRTKSDPDQIRPESVEGECSRRG